MSAICPACGVAVVSGYVRCPKCGANLPARRATTVSAGGTSISTRGGFPIVPVAAGAALLGVIVLAVALRGGDEAPAPAPVEPAEPAAAFVERSEPSPAPEPIPSAPAPTTPDPAAAAADLDRSLKRERLWGTVQVIGARVDVRSGACSDPGMDPVLDAAIPPLREAGLTKLRCLEQSGAVVFERDL